MSVFECPNGHPMPSGVYRCKVCGGRLHTMDGMTEKDEAWMSSVDAEEKDGEGEE